ncbi:MAG TPA: hypothetical protein VLH77_05865 [Gammaproteobacteria bacterium]|nr:hypothetical protein [Gammaproteobacteria bacterium]
MSLQINAIQTTHSPSHYNNADETPAPFDFDDSITFSLRNAITALGEAINGLMSIQPELIASEMGISTELVSPQVEKWSNAFLSILQHWESQISGASSPSQQQLAEWQGDMQVANSDSGSSSSALNGVMSMLTSGTSSKTSTYQNLVQQASSVVTALLNAMAQNWS